MKKIIESLTQLQNVGVMALINVLFVKPDSILRQKDKGDMTLLWA